MISLVMNIASLYLVMHMWTSLRITEKSVLLYLFILSFVFGLSCVVLLMVVFGSTHRISRNILVRVFSIIAIPSSFYLITSLAGILQFLFSRNYHGTTDSIIIQLLNGLIPALTMLLTTISLRVRRFLKFHHGFFIFTCIYALLNCIVGPVLYRAEALPRFMLGVLSYCGSVFFPLLLAITGRVLYIKENKQIADSETSQKTGDDNNHPVPLSVEVEQEDFAVRSTYKRPLLSFVFAFAVFLLSPSISEIVTNTSNDRHSGLEGYANQLRMANIAENITFALYVATAALIVIGFFQTLRVSRKRLDAIKKSKVPL
jgi:hypothetical protein